MQHKLLFGRTIESNKGFNLSTSTIKPKRATDYLHDEARRTQKPEISKKAGAILKQKHSALYKWLFDYMNKTQGEGGAELCYDSIRFEKLSPDLVESLMPVLMQLYYHY